MSVPTMTIVGNLGTDPEIRTSASGKPVASLFVVSQDRRKNPQTGEWENADQYTTPAVAFGPLADHCRCLSKGMRVIATGRMVEERYRAQDGTERVVKKLKLSDIGPSLSHATVQVQRDNTQSQQQPGYGQSQQPGYGQGSGFGAYTDGPY